MMVKHRRVIANAVVVAATLGASLLLLYPPGSNGFYPACPIFTYLHVQCPGCGTTRALLALLSGHIEEALRLNPLSAGLLPLGICYAGVCYGRAVRTAEFIWPLVPNPAIYVTLAASAVFTIVRNLF